MLTIKLSNFLASGSKYHIKMKNLSVFSSESRGKGQNFGFFTIRKSDRPVKSDKNKMQFLENYHDLNFEGKN